MSEQTDWRYCGKCHGMFYDGYPEKGTCPAGSGHDAIGYNFVLPHDVPGTPTAQDAWRYCGKCHGMFYDGYPEKGTCPAGGGHDAIGYNFVLPHPPTITLRAIADQGRFLEVTGSGFTPDQTVTLDYLFKLQSDVNTSTSGAETLRSNGTGSFIFRIRVTLTDISIAQVKATDVASGKTATALLEGV